MKALATLIIISVIYSQALWAATEVPYRIQAVCSENAPPNRQDQIELKLLLERVQTRFAQKEQRLTNPTGFVSALDAVINKTRFAPLLTCRDKIKKMKGYSYAIKFQDINEGNQNMDVTNEVGKESDGTRAFRITLGFNLAKSVQRVLFVYLHELTHVCQSVRYESIYNKVALLESVLAPDDVKQYENLITSKDTSQQVVVPPKLKEYDEAFGDAVRFHFVREIEAFYNQHLAYRDLIEVSPRLCRGEAGNSSEKPDAPLFQAYLPSETSLHDGTFAQGIVSGYWDNNYNLAHFLFEPAFDPTASQAWDAKGKYRSFNPKMIDAVGTLQIIVTEQMKPRF